MATNSLPPIPKDEIKEIYSWRDWFNNLGLYIQRAQTGNVPWTILQGGTGSSTVSGARYNLGIGTLGVQNSNTVAITGGDIAANVSLTNSTATTVGATGTASALPALPVGYVVITISGTDYKLPYYNT
jgi:hypothetical protein